MRWALISDIHANLQALDAVLSSAAQLDCERCVCLGDVVGYGADPDACLQRVAARCESVIMGNHDAAAVGMTDTSYFNPTARAAAEWTAAELSADHTAYLRDLPYTDRFDGFETVHSTPDDPPAWHYLLSEFDAGPMFGFFDERLLCYGHTHVPMAFRRGPKGDVRQIDFGEVELEDGCRYIVNVGSVGQPRDGDPRAAFTVYDDGAGRLELQRLEYDIEGAQRAIELAGLPKVLAARLDQGR